MKRDQVFRDPQQQIVDFVFDEKVAAAFTDMIRRSVPGYEVVVPMTGLLAAGQLESAAEADLRSGLFARRHHDGNAASLW